MAAPSFYCENCGREVPLSMSSCPGCGQKFLSVRCPTCGFTGVPELFKKSCPECGYDGRVKENEDTGQNSYIIKSGTTESRESKKHFPPWLYHILIGLMIIIILILLSVYILL